MRTNFYLDEVSHNYVGELPRKVNASKIMRFMLKAIFDSESEWTAFLETDKDAAIIKEYLRKKLKGRL